MNKTLEGKLAGLQDATALREENEKFRKREDDMFKKMAEKQRYGGKNLQNYHFQTNNNTINELNKFSDSNTVRDRKTGRRANKPEDIEKQREKLKKEEERKQVYDVWGRGLKQIEEYKSRVATETHEMNKPVARYANDEDLDEYLRTQCRDGDPMAEHFRKKRNEAQSGPSKKFLHAHRVWEAENTESH